MNRQFWISSSIMSIASLMAGFVVHALWLKPDYAALTSVYRNDQESQPFFPVMLLAHLFIGFAMTWVYRQGRKDHHTLGQGIRFGIGICCLSTIPWYLIYLAVIRIPSDLAIKQIAFDVPMMIMLGIIVAYLNRE